MLNLPERSWSKDEVVNYIKTFDQELDPAARHFREGKRHPSRNFHGRYQ